MEIEKKYVYDSFLRVLHFLIAAFTIILILSSKLAEFNQAEGYLRKTFWIIHIFAGFGLCIAFLLRVFWGFFGSYHAKWKRLIKTEKWGHHRIASIFYLVFYLGIFILSITGLLLSAIEHDRGPFAEVLFDELTYRHLLLKTHEIVSWLILFFICSHLFALWWHEKKDGLPLVQSMFSGFQYKKINKGDNE